MTWLDQSESNRKCEIIKLVGGGKLTFVSLSVIVEFSSRPLERALFAAASVGGMYPAALPAICNTPNNTDLNFEEQNYESTWRIKNVYCLEL